MAKLSTPSHACQQPYTANEQGVTAHCPWAAYRKVDGRWLCRTHGRQARARIAAMTPSPEHAAAIAGACSHGGHGWDGETCDDIPMFEVVGIVTTSDPIYGGDIFARIEATQRSQS